MSTTTYRNNVNRINGQIADLKKKQTAERKKEVDLTTKINELNRRVATSSSSSTIQSYQRQIDSKSKESIRASEKVADFHKKITDKNKELTRNQDYLTKELEKETKKRQSSELSFLKEKERLNRSELNNIRNINSELDKQQTVFQNYTAEENDLSSGNDEDYSLKELIDLHSRIDDVLSKLEKLGFGQEIIFDEIEELKSKSKKISKKDLKMILIGKLVSFGGGKIDSDTASQIFETITEINLTKYIG
jgi:iron-sulfur cluster repair protein YtfE (RIC family)